MKRRNFLKTGIVTSAMLSNLELLAKSQSQKLNETGNIDGKVIILQGTPGGIAAAIGAARMGLEVIIIERTPHIGGLPANGLGATDIMSKGATAGLFQEFLDHNLNYYKEKYGANSQQVKDCSDGYHFEPSVAEISFEKMLKAYSSITVKKNRQFNFDQTGVIKMANDSIQSIKVLNRVSGIEEEYVGDIFIDASYEGDLLAASNIPYKIGREGKEEHGEIQAGTFYKYWAGPEIKKYSNGQGDNAIQAYNYRLCLTNRKEDVYPIIKPENYNRFDYLSLLNDVNKMQCADYRIMQVPQEERLNAISERFAKGVKMRFRQYVAGINSVVNIVKIPNGKSDANNHHIALISTDLPEENWPWPSSNWEWRDRFAQRLKDYTLGFLWFCQNDTELPQWFKDDCKKWGLSKSEYTNNEYFPRQVYVREGRRLDGMYTFTANDVTSSKEQRPKVHSDSITSSHYALDSHACRKRVPDVPLLEGLFSYQVKPYTVPFSVMVPKTMKNLLCPVAASASHVGFATLRMEPCWIALGQAAGVACGVMINDNLAVQSVSIKKVQEELLDQKVKLIQYTDVPLDHKAFSSIQKLGLTGKLKEWELKPDELVSTEQAKKWCSIFGLSFIKIPKKCTNGECLVLIENNINN